MSRLLALAVLIGIAVGGTALYSKMYRSESQKEAFRTDKVMRGDLQIVVRATGTVEPEETVDVGAQVVGRIKSLGKDPRGQAPPHVANKPIEGKTAETNTNALTAYDPQFANKPVDYGSPVIKDMVLAQIDPAIYKAQFDQATASLKAAEANVLQTQAKLNQAEAEWVRAQRLREIKIPSRSPTGDDNGTQALPIKGISDADYVLAQANAEVAKADLEAAKAAVLQQQAMLEMAETNLKYTTIVSPIDGTIIDRRVNIGQTVVSSLNAPSLFLIARDLRRMQVWAAVNEADIAKIKPGTKVHFRVDALPEDTFHGTVVQVRLNAQMTQNVVIYTVVISVDNSDLKLLPYMTADVNFEVDQRKDVLLVPNAALRFRPTPGQIASEPADEDAEPKNVAKGRGDRASKPAGAATNIGRLWEVVPGTSTVRPIEVRTGQSDMAVTEITSGDIEEGDEIVIGQAHQSPAAGSDMNNPLGPPRFRRSAAKNPG
jgi:HlyD family secretion protein